MYPDTILFIVAAVCAVLMIMLSGYLVYSRKKDYMYRKILQEETVFFDTLKTTSLMSHSYGEESINGEPGETEYEYAETEYLDVSPKQMKENTRLNMSLAQTEMLVNKEHTSFGLDTSSLADYYVLENEIIGGGMSRVFLARNKKLGNQWIVKYIPNHIGKLTNEIDILKQLNHISLPKIVDIFQDENGIFIVESYVEGVSLQEVMVSSGHLNQFVVYDWAEQLAQVLSYLHMIKPNPIIHLDLKPSNIMVTHHNKLVLIDFGISKEYGSGNQTGIGVTYKYAAPEQLKEEGLTTNNEIIKRRFGELPLERVHWTLDARTDLYSYGAILFEMLVGQIPTLSNRGLLKDAAPEGLAKVIDRCIQVEPSRRYQSIDELIADLQTTRRSKTKMVRSLFVRRMVIASMIGSFFMSSISFASGSYILQQENMAVLETDYEALSISVQEPLEIEISKIMSDGRAKMLDAEKIEWSFSDPQIAKVDGNQVMGVNPGNTRLIGNYRDKEIEINIHVVEPMNGIVEISQIYHVGNTVARYAGTSIRESKDGNLELAEFVSPESIDITEDGTIYLVDSGVLRMISGNFVQSIIFDQAFLVPKLIHEYQEGFIFLTHEWEENDKMVYGFVQASDNQAEIIYLSDAVYTAIEDFVVSPEGKLYFIERNEGVHEWYLKSVDLSEIENISTLCKLKEGTSSLAFGNNEVLFLGNSDLGVIYRYENGQVLNFAGIESDRAFIDGELPKFYQPLQMECKTGYLYVWDFNSLRRIEILDNCAGEVISIAGEASPVFDKVPPEGDHKAEAMIFPNSNMSDFIIEDEIAMITDPKRGVLWQVTLENNGN